MSALALLLIAGTTIGAGAANLAPTPRKTLSAVQMAAVQEQADNSMKRLDKNYAKQAKTQAQYYRKLAKQVSKSGGDAQPLLDVAAYFDSKAKK
jgi:hypothetical protein